MPRTSLPAQPDETLQEDPKAQHLRAKLLNEIGWIYYLQGRYEEAEATYNSSLEPAGNGRPVQSRTAN